MQPQWYETRNQLQGAKREEYKQAENKQHASKKTKCQWRNKRENRKIPQGKWKWKHKTPKSMGCNTGLLQ